MDILKIRGARTNNLKNINLDIPKNKLTVITGLSGSGKSSLAFDTIYAEGQRRYVESLSAYARQFLGLMDKPDVDLIEGLQPAISIDQKSSGHNPRSTVGTVTEIYDYLRLLYARVGHPRSPITGKRLQKQSVQQIVDDVLNFSKIVKKEVRINILAPIIKNRKGTYEELFTRFQSQGYIRIRVDGEVYNLEEDIKLDKFIKHNIELVVDRLSIPTSFENDEERVNFCKRLTDSIELSLSLGDGEVLVGLNDKEIMENLKRKDIRENGDIFYSEKLVDPASGTSFPEIEPHSFSFNSPFGACQICNGLGTVKEIEISNIYNPRLTIDEGGIYPLARAIENEESMTYKILETVANVEGISLKTPLGQLSKGDLDIILYGSKGKNYSVEYFDSNGNLKVWNVKYEGVVPNLQRRYLETDSEFIRSEIEQYMFEKECSECHGYRLRKDVLGVTIRGKNIVDVGNMTIERCYSWISNLESGENKLDSDNSTLEELFGIKNIDLTDDELSSQEKEISKQIIKEIKTRLNFLNSVGLDYLTLNRSAKTLSGGESQRIRLASQIGTGLTGVLYVLDEPSIGLHQRDNSRLIETLEKLRDLGNTVIVVEHDEDTIRKADYIVDIGPGAGEHGGEVVAYGKVKDIENEDNSITGKYLSKKIEISKDKIIEEVKNISILQVSPKSKGSKESEYLTIRGINHHNLKNVDLELPLKKFVCVTGVSGSGKSSLIKDVLYKTLAKELYGAKDIPGNYKEMIGIEKIDKVINIDQSPIGRTPRSNPATYTGIFNIIRELFAQTKESKIRGYKAGRFSFNVKGGRCENCEGAGVIKISMQFLPDVYVKCDVCSGNRYNRDTLQIDYKGKNISDVLNMTVEEGVEFFRNINAISSKLETLNEVGLGYIRLGQSATTLSGGESQRVKLASELSKKQTGKTIYILDEPTTGLHFEDVRKLLIVLHGLVLKGNSVVIIEHNLDVIKTADWIIDLGPEGGEKGGNIIAEGTTEQIKKSKNSFTGEWLSKI